MAKKFLTLDVGAANVALAEYGVGSSGALTLLKYGVAPLAASLDSGDSAALLNVSLQEIMRSTGMRPGPVALSISGQLVFPKFAAIPSAGGEERFEQLVRYEVEQNIPFPIDEMICDRQVLGDTPAGDRNVMIIAAKTEQVEAVTSAVSAAGFSPTLVDVAPLATVNAVRAVAGDGECVMVLDIGAKTTSLVISEGDRLYNRSIPIAGNNITREIAQAIGCTVDEAEQYKLERGYVSAGGVVEDEDELTDRVSKVCRAVLTRLNAEISRSINFYRSQQEGSAPTRLFLTGGTALLPQLDSFFAESLQLEVTLFNPFEAISVSPSVSEDALAVDAAQLAATAGLALHTAKQARFEINLLPPSIVSARADLAKVPVVAASVVLFVAALALVWLSVGRDVESIESQREALQSQVSELEKFDRRIKAAVSEAEAAEARAEAMRALVSSRGAALARLNAVRGALDRGMWIESWREGRVTVRGWKDRLSDLVARTAQKNGGKAQTAGEIFADRLKRSAVVVPESVRILDMKEIGANKEVDQFTVELKFK